MLCSKLFFIVNGLFFGISRHNKSIEVASSNKIKNKYIFFFFLKIISNSFSYLFQISWFKQSTVKNVYGSGKGLHSKF